VETMKSLILTFLAIIVFSLSTKAQTNWSPWVTVYQDEAYPTPHFVQVSYSMAAHCNGYSHYRTNSNFEIQYGTVSFYYDYLDCDGQTQSEQITVELDKPGIYYNYTSTWFIGSKVVTQFRNVVFYQPPVINNAGASTSSTSNLTSNSVNTSPNSSPQNNRVNLTTTYNTNTAYNTTPAQETNQKQAQMRQFTNNVTNQMQGGEQETTTQVASDLGGAVGNLIGAISNHNNRSNNYSGYVENHKDRTRINEVENSSDVAALLHAGSESFNDCNYVDAMFCYNKAARLGSLEAMYELRYFYKESNPSISIYWDEQAKIKEKEYADKDDIICMSALAHRITSYPNGKPSDALVYYFEILRLCSNKVFTSDDRGSAEYRTCYRSQYEIGKIYSVWNEDNKTEEQSLIDALSYFNQSLLLAKNKQGKDYKEEDFIKDTLKPNISAVEKRLKKIK